MENKCNRRKNWANMPLAEVLKNKYHKIEEHATLPATWVVSIDDPNHRLIECDCAKCKEG